MQFTAEIFEEEGLKAEVWKNPESPELTKDPLDRKNWKATITGLIGVVPDILEREKYVTCFFDEKFVLRRLDWWQYTRF
jgi:hypothetical protein